MRPDLARQAAGGPRDARPRSPPPGAAGRAVPGCLGGVDVGGDPREESRGASAPPQGPQHALSTCQGDSREHRPRSPDWA